jgi:outer membrane receptor protein involved in Fe transport
MNYTKNKISLAIIMAGTVISTAAHSDDAIDSQLEVIMVTAEKRVSSLQETAIAVTAMDSRALERKNIEDNLDLQFAVPNLVIGENTRLTLRGVGQNVLGGGADPAVSTSFNSMPIAPTSELYDLERVEVLRGPQGTLFGRNTTGGVINMISARPTDIFEAEFTAQVANFGSIRTKGAINIPLSDTVYQRFAFNTVDRDGYTENIYNDTDIDGRDEHSIRSTTRFEPSDNFDATFLVQVYNEDSSRLPAAKVVCDQSPVYGCASTTSNQTNYPADFKLASVDNFLYFPALLINPSEPFSFPAILKDDRFAQNPNPKDLRTVSMDTDPVFQIDETFASLELNYKLNKNLTLTSATAYLDWERVQFRDFDLGAAPNAFNDTIFSPGGALTYMYDGELQARTDYSPTQRNNTKSEYISQEFRIASSYDGRFNYLVGVAYFKEEAFFDGQTFTPALTSLPTITQGAVQVSGGFYNFVDRWAKSYAVFGEIYYDINDDITLTTGLRYTEDEKFSVGATSAFGPHAAVPVEGGGEWDEFTGKVNINWQLDKDSMIYTTLSRGYKGGGLNPQIAVAPTFDPEYVNSFEVGTKNTLLDNRMRINASAFIYDYENLQVGGLIDGASANFNAEEVDIKGLEIESTYLVTDRLLINANISFMDTEIVKSDPLPNTSLGYPVSAIGLPVEDENGRVVPFTEDVVGNELPFAPKMSYNVSAQYTFPVGDSMELRARLDHYWQDDFFSREFDNYEVESWGRTDASLTLIEISGQWEVEAFVKNINDDDSITGGSSEARTVGLFRKLRLLDPRTYGIEVTYRWE